MANWSRKCRRRRWQRQTPSYTMVNVCYPALHTAYNGGKQQHDPGIPPFYDPALYARSRKFVAVRTGTRCTATDYDTHAATSNAAATASTNAAAALAGAATTPTDATAALAGAAATPTAAATTAATSLGGTNHQMRTK